jgi:hypothetical protein
MGGAAFRQFLRQVFCAARFKDAGERGKPRHDELNELPQPDR